MTDDINKNPIPRVVRGTGFFTPMDLAPGETPTNTSTTQPAPPTAPTPTNTPTPAEQPAQPTGDGYGTKE